MALINGIIPQQNFELIRDRIGAILALELANQYDLDNTFPLPQSIDIERFIPYDADQEFPAINVNFWKGEYSNTTQIKTEGTYYFNVDCYADSPTIGTNRGDNLSSAKLQRIMGACRAILKNPVYLTLGFQPNVNGISVIGRCEVQGMYVANKSIVPDALNETVGRVIVKILALETVNLIDSANFAQEVTTSLKINNSTKGYFFDLMSLITDANGNFLTDLIGNNIINPQIV
jgi:hypothetical protein